jgi:hypothetical protein
LYDMPLLQRLQSHHISGVKLVFYHFINLFRLKRGASKFTMSWLRASLAFLTRVFPNGSFRFYDVTRRWFGRIVGILLQPRDTFLELPDRFSELLYFRRQVYDQKIFIVHAVCVTYNPQKRNCLF